MKTSTLITHLFGVLTTILLSADVMAQDGSSKKWSLQDCLDYAQRNNLNLRRSQLQTISSRNNLIQSQAALLPNVNGSTGYSISSGGRAVDPWTNTAIQNEDIKSSSMGISASVNLFSGMQQQNTIKARRQSKKAAEFDVLNQSNTIQLNVIQSYTNILSGYEQVAASTLQVDLTKNQLDRTAKLVKAGAAPEVNLLNLKAQLASDELSLITAQNNLDIAKLQLQQLMQKPVDAAFEIEKISIDEPSAPDLNESAEAIYKIAESNQPQIKAADTRVKEAQHNLEVAFGSYLPTLSLTAGYFTNYASTGARLKAVGTTISPNGSFTRDANGDMKDIVYQANPIFEREKIGASSQLNDNLRRSISFSLNLPIFNGLQARTNHSNSKVNLYAAKASADVERNTLRQTVEQAWLDARLAYKRFYATKQQVLSLKEALRANEARLNVGAINAVDYNAAKTSLNRAETDLIRSKYDFLLRSKILDFYAGRPLNLDSK